MSSAPKGELKPGCIRESTSSARARLCALRFHSLIVCSVKGASSASITLAQSPQSQMPLFADFRSSGVRRSLYLGPPRAAAVMCAARPSVITPSPSSVAETVGATQPGREQCQATCFPSLFFVASVKLSLFPVKMPVLRVDPVFKFKTLSTPDGHCPDPPIPADFTLTDVHPIAQGRSSGHVARKPVCSQSSGDK